MKNHILPPLPRRASGPWSHRSALGVKIPPGSIRMITLETNRGKGGAVTQGMKHARGSYVLFADADGATKFTDLSNLVSAAQSNADSSGRCVAVGSRAHLVGTNATVQRSRLRNLLMYGFHTYLWLITPPATAKIKDTQCGFKLFSRASLPFIIPYMHSEGWVFDVEMLMLAEFAGIPVVEVPVGWREVGGSKLNVVRDSIGMAWNLAVLRVCWGLGIYRR
jgi:dolichyl-phosphate beta-glucosyltransferase